jgi:hypothetical protein
MIVNNGWGKIASKILDSSSVMGLLLGSALSGYDSVAEVMK